MKKSSILILFSVLLFGTKVFAQTTPATPTAATSTPADVIKLDSTAVKEYVGKFKMKNAPFEHVNTSIQGGKLYGEAEGQGSAELAPTKDVDIFEIVGYGGTVKFVRGDDKKIKGCVLNMQGNEMEGEKEK